MSKRKAAKALVETKEMTTKALEEAREMATKALEEARNNPRINNALETMQEQMQALAKKQDEFSTSIKKILESRTEAATEAATAAATRWDKAKQWIKNNPWKTAGTIISITSGPGRWALDKAIKAWNWNPDNLKSEETPEDNTQVPKVVVEDPIDAAIQKANQQVQKPSVNYNAIDSLFTDYK